jgi:SAM-dependent methyltransferase
MTYRRTTRVRGIDILQCTRCHLATWDWPTYDPAAFYDESYWRSDEIGKGYADYFSLAEAMRVTHARRLLAIRQRLGHLPPGDARPRLLDAGCGPGYFVRAAADFGFEARGIEVSQYAVDFARRELGVDVRQGTIAATDLPPGPFDVVTLWDVIEHLPAPLAALRAAAGLLRPGGFIVLSTGDYASLVARLSGAHWHLFNLPEHLWFFTPGSLRRLLSRAGFAPVDFYYELCWHPIRYLVERIESAFRLGRVLSPALGALGRAVLPVTLGDVMTLAARCEVRSEK